MGPDLCLGDVIPTKAGRRLFEYAGQVFSLLEEAERIMEGFKNLP